VVDERFHRGEGSYLHDDSTAEAITDRLVAAAKGGGKAVRETLRKIGAEIERAGEETKDIHFQHCWQVGCVPSL
jgi:hypothetical protein